MGKYFKKFFTFILSLAFLLTSLTPSAYSQSIKLSNLTSNGTSVYKEDSKIVDQSILPKLESNNTTSTAIKLLPQNNTTNSAIKANLNDEELMELESKKSFEFFWKETNSNVNSLGYGLTRDRAPGNPNACSVASIGFGLTAYVIGAERGWVTKEEAYNRTLGTLNTLLNNAENVNGFFYHFLDMNTAKRFDKSEVSIIDTAIAVNGAFTAGEYFGGEIKEKAEKIYERVDWEWYRDPNRNQFYMGYSPEKGFSGWWDFYAEQLMLYVLGAASPTHPISSDMFYSFTRNYATYGDYPEFIHSWFGSIFTYQFSHAWIDFNNKTDKKGVNWWTNSVIASKSNRQFCIDNDSKFKTFGPNSWGLTASDGPDGYEGRYGAAPSGFSNDQHRIDGTIPPAGALGSIVFTPEESLKAMRNYYENYPNLFGEYGFKDAYNLDKSSPWYASDVIGIDKGITLLMIENYRSNLVWNYYMSNKYVQSGIRKIGVIDIGTSIFDDFEGNSLNNGWKDGGDGVYTITESNNISYTGLKSLKIDFNKNNFSWANMQTTLKDTNISSANTLSANVYNANSEPIELLLKFETNRGAHEQKFTINSSKKWETIKWDISSFKNDLSNINKVIIFAAPGVENSKGTFYIDDIELHTSKLGVSGIIIDGKPIVGETLNGHYNYYNLDGVKEGKSQYRWLSSDTVNGNYLPIKGAVSKSYTITKNDVGKFIKFEVTPVAINSEVGAASQSDATQMVQEAAPVAKNVTITKQPIDETVIIDDFDGNKVSNNWMDSGDGIYTTSIDNHITKDGKNALKVDFNKKTEWGFLYCKFDTPEDFSKANLLNLKIYGNPKLIIKFENSKGEGIKEKWVEPSGNEWKDFVWDLSGFKEQLKDVKRILFFAAPGEKDINGTFYIDDFKLINRTIIDVTLDGIPKVGEKLIGSYVYTNAKGGSELGTTYRWLRSRKKDGHYTIIPFATNKEYTVRKEDRGMYLKFEVTPKSSTKPYKGRAVRSSASNLVN